MYKTISAFLVGATLLTAAPALAATSTVPQYATGTPSVANPVVVKKDTVVVKKKVVKKVMVPKKTHTKVMVKKTIMHKTSKKVMKKSVGSASTTTTP